jgi:hypothetical protein
VFRFTVLAIIVVSACSPASRSGIRPAGTPLVPHSLVGCWRMGDHRFAFDSIPASFLLLRPVEGGMQAWSYFDAGESAYWRVLPGDTVEFVWGDLLHGQRFRGVVQGGGLAGRVTGWSDIVGAPEHSARRTAHTEPCSTDGSSGAPPPNARVLRDTFPAAVMNAMLESLQPYLRQGLPLGARTTTSYGFGARLARLLAARSDLRPPRPDETFAIWVRAEDYSLQRDSASAVVFTSVCEDVPGTRFRDERARYRFIRDGSGWRLKGVDVLDREEGTCGPNRSGDAPGTRVGDARPRSHGSYGFVEAEPADGG